MISMSSIASEMTVNDHRRMDDYNYIENIEIVHNKEKVMLPDMFSYSIKNLTITLIPYTINTDVDMLVSQLKQKLLPDKIQYVTYKNIKNKEAQKIIFMYNMKPKWMKGNHIILNR